MNEAVVARLLRRLGESVDSLLHREIKHERPDIAPAHRELGRERFRLLARGAIGEIDIEALAHELADDGGAEALAAAGHEDALGLGHAGSVLEFS